MSYQGHIVCAVGALVLAAGTPAAGGGDDPFADQWISYDQGVNAADGFTNPDVAVGSPERFTGECLFPTVVSAFSPPYCPQEIVSVGAGGHLVVRFDTPVTDDPRNPHGIDLLIFGNEGFEDCCYPSGIVLGPFGLNGGTVEVSGDGERWFLIEGVDADGMFPTIGYLDSGPYDSVPGREPSDFTRPVDPRLAADDFVGLNNQEVIGMYAGSGGGAGIDLAWVGLDAISYVRITNPPPTTDHFEIDAVSDVAPEANPADIDMDGVVGILDLLLLLGAWGPCPDPPATCPADLDGDTTVGIVDLLSLLGAWGS